MAVSRSDLLVATQHRLARAMDAIPAPVARRIAGTDRDADGMALDPHLAMILRLGERAQPDRHGTPVDEQRAAIRESSRVAAGPPIAVGEVRDLTVDGAEGPLRARLYSPAGSTSTPRALLVYFHGGGWVVGDLDTHDQPCRLLCRYADVHVLSVDYRLAPEHPAPAAAHDAVAAYRWALAHAEALGADPRRVAVGGDSAGGNLAAVVAQQARNSGIQAPAAQLLLYPGADASRPYPSKDLFSEGYFLTKRQMDWYWDTYSAGASRTDPWLSPLCADDLSGLAPAIVTTAAFDPLRDEGEAYAAALREAGTTVVLRRAAGLVHGYLSMTGIHRASLDESLAVAGALGALLAIDRADPTP
jgi:acetyl esterase